MKIVAAKIKNYRVFESLEIKDIPAFYVIIGANGTGKSTSNSKIKILRGVGLESTPVKVIICTNILSIPST